MGIPQSIVLVTHVIDRVRSPKTLKKPQKMSKSSKTPQIVQNTAQKEEIGIVDKVEIKTQNQQKEQQNEQNGKNTSQDIDIPDQMIQRENIQQQYYYEENDQISENKMDELIEKINFKNNNNEDDLSENNSFTIEEEQEEEISLKKQVMMDELIEKINRNTSKENSLKNSSNNEDDIIINGSNSFSLEEEQEEIVVSTSQVILEKQAKDSQVKMTISQDFQYAEENKQNQEELIISESISTVQEIKEIKQAFEMRDHEKSWKFIQNKKGISIQELNLKKSTSKKIINFSQYLNKREKIACLKVYFEYNIDVAKEIFLKIVKTVQNCIFLKGLLLYISFIQFETEKNILQISVLLRRKRKKEGLCIDIHFLQDKLDEGILSILALLEGFMNLNFLSLDLQKCEISIKDLQKIMRLVSQSKNLKRFKLYHSLTEITQKNGFQGNNSKWQMTQEKGKWVEWNYKNREI